jgi:prophage regulatory protein
MDDSKAPAAAAGPPRPPRRMLRLPTVEERTGISRSSIYRAMEKDGFPRPARVGRRAVAWVESEVEGWIERKLMARGGA